jgi:protoporphyrinogen/coproporphyrinogen III oxidase
LPPLGSFRAGMAALPERIAEHLGPAIRYGIKVAALSYESAGDGVGGTWRIATSANETFTAQNVILAAPSHVAATLLSGVTPDLAALLEPIEYAPLCVVSSAYERRAVQNSLDGFGFMVPRHEGLGTICTFWNSSLFPGRASNGQVVITSFVRTKDLPGSTDSQEITQRAISENARILEISGAPVETQVWHDARALPQYNVGHAGRVSRIEAALPQHPGLQIIGSFLHGRSIGDCVDLAFAAADNLHSRMGSANI